MRCTLAAHATGHCAPWPLGPRVHACCCRRRWPCREPVDTPHSCADPNEFVLSMCIPPPFLSQGFALYFHECQPQQILPLLPARQGDHTIARPDISLASSCSALGFSGLDLGFEDLGFQWVCVKCRGAIQSEGLGWCSSFPVLCIRGSGQPFIPRQEKFSIQIPSIRESFTIQIPDCRESFSSQIPDYRTTRDLPMACRCEQAAC